MPKITEYKIKNFAIDLLIFLKKGPKMTSKLSFIEFIVDQIENAGDISYRKMFGEYSFIPGTKT